jgi:hypothetical protein
MRALDFGLDVEARFLPSRLIDVAGQNRILLDGRVSGQPQLQRGQEFMSRAQFAEAHHEFRSVFDVATAAGDTLLRADAACWLGWFYGELEQFCESRHWTALSIRLIEHHLGMRTGDIIDSVSVSRTPGATSKEAVHTLSRALRFYSKILAVRLVHHTEMVWIRETNQAFDRSVRLDERLQLPELGHALRWKAVAMSAEDRSQIKDIDQILSASREHFPTASAVEASLIRERGIVRWQKSRLATASDFLREAKNRLAIYADARALGPTFCVLSKIIIQEGRDSDLARRYALIAAGLHPYGYVLGHCADQLAKTAPAERLRDFDDLTAGEKPFDVVHQVLARVVHGSPNSSAQILQRNLARVRAALLPPRCQIALSQTPTHNTQVL